MFSFEVCTTKQVYEHSVNFEHKSPNKIKHLLGVRDRDGDGLSVMATPNKSGQKLCSWVKLQDVQL